jgi:hypothetical protein
MWWVAVVLSLQQVLVTEPTGKKRDDKTDRRKAPKIGTNHKICDY